MQKGRAARAGPARFTNYSISPRELRYAYSSPSLIRARARAFPAMYTYVQTYTHVAPPRTTVRATSQRINNRDSHIRALDALTNSQLHPKCIRFASDARPGGTKSGERREEDRASSARRSCADARISIAAFLFFRVGLFAEDWAEEGRAEEGVESEDLYDVCLPLAVAFPFFLGSTAPRALNARSKRTVVVADARPLPRQIDIADRKRGESLIARLARRF